MTDFSLEKAAMARGCAAVCGCDEAGAGPLMGPVYAAAVILPVDCRIPGLDDSKKLTRLCSTSSANRRRRGRWPLSVQRRSTQQTSSAPG